MSEYAEQIRVVEWCRTTAWKRKKDGLEDLGLDLIFHIPNGGLRSKSEASRLKNLGVLKGVSDLFLPVMVESEGQTFGGLWIEMKGEKGRVGVEQEKWIETMRRRGYRAVVAFGADEAIRAIAEYVGIRHVGMADAP